LGQIQGESTKESPRPPAIELTRPEGPTIPLKNRLQGPVSNLRAGESVWTFFAETADPVRIYPMPGPCPVKDGQWMCPKVYIGEGRDTRRYHVWAAVITDVEPARAVRAIRKYDPDAYVKEPLAKEPSHVGDALDHRIFLRR
jgi:hypothetical protein